ncbi:chaperone protein dnaJ 20, chloroplastic-like [Cucurbita pepo subsp. pepo]|uniref:chaperone protein dnaJ 20, chloroplastic-like n=1 Tax=Cucurbita pepo subsp. pepo TaxID=3664 RepID=UPI000C9D5E91|nr:chaperone protein dnaJ 20, chloroplastic-like [Cucurbita pepo subsp. pepo]
MGHYKAVERRRNNREMQCSDFTYSGGDYRILIPSSPSITGRRKISGQRSRVFFPNTPPCNSSRLPSLSIRAKASFNGGIASSEAADGSFYDLLGISESGSLAEIKRAYKQLARKYHPDVSPPGRAEEYTKRFIRVQEAYETLSDPRRRALYDRDMVGGLQVAFSARRRFDVDEGVPDKSAWKSCWKAQISELKRRSMDKDSKHNLSWGDRMRQQMNEQV